MLVFAKAAYINIDDNWSKKGIAILYEVVVRHGIMEKAISSTTVSPHLGYFIRARTSMERHGAAPSRMSSPGWRVGSGPETSES